MIEVLRNKVRNYRSAWTFIIYCFVGVASALVDIFTLKVTTSYLNIEPLISISIAYTLGLLVNYYLHNAVTFKTAMSRNSFIRYLTIVLLNYIITLLLIYFLQKIGFTLIVSKIITLPVISITGFIFSKIWIYKSKE